MDISAKVQQLSDDVSTMRNDICQMRENTMEQNEMIISLIQEQNKLLKRLINGEEDEGEKKSSFLKKLPKFPIENQTQLDEFENSITEENKEELVSFLRPILMPLGLKKNIRYVLSTEVAISYNVDGSHGKSRLLDYPKLLNLLFRATEREGWSYRLFMDDLRQGLQYSKKRHFKAKSEKKRKGMMMSKMARRTIKVENTTPPKVKNPIETEEEDESSSSEDDDDDDDD